MARITIRNLDDAIKTGLRLRAAEHGRSVEEEARDILHRAVGPSPAAVKRFAALNVIDLPPRDAMPTPPHFD